MKRIPPCAYRFHRVPRQPAPGHHQAEAPEEQDAEACRGARIDQRVFLGDGGREGEEPVTALRAGRGHAGVEIIVEIIERCRIGGGEQIGEQVPFVEYLIGKVLLRAQAAGRRRGRGGR